MARRRKTKSERESERWAKEQAIWQAFFPRLRACQSLTDAIVLVHEAVPEGRPGRKFYSNLGFFLNTFSAPDGASATELAAYIAIVERDPVLRPDQKETAIGRLRSALPRP